MAGKGRKYNVGEYSFQPYERTKAQKSFFFLGDKLYKMIRQDRAQNILWARSFPEKEEVSFILSDAKRQMKNAYDTKEVAKMMNRQVAVIQSYVNNGYIPSPMRVYQQGRNAYGHPFNKMKWSEKDILRLHDFLLTNGGGRPRKDGQTYSATRLPTRQELLAILKSRPMFYMQSSDGTMVPVWSAYNEV